MSYNDYYSDDGVYEVEEIKGARVQGGKTQYLVKWKNMPECSNTWEDEEVLEYHQDLINNFLSKLNGK
ncbi:La ribonucleoprotein [Tritrichomonas musculus]|uniref:La ribonucleoprotein n=1 Tax=Tritrichomonas musculus TaxID=1915356 RepID=A0ABR2GUY5_9EUKA